MLSEEEKKLLKIFKAQVEKEETEYFSVNAYTQLLHDSHKTVLNLITKLQKEVDYQKEKRENQKVELAILNEKQKEMNKLINTVSSYKGMLKKEQKDNEKKDKIIDLMSEWLYEDDTSFGYGKLKDINTSEKIKQYFERKVKK